MISIDQVTYRLLSFLISFCSHFRFIEVIDNTHKHISVHIDFGNIDNAIVVFPGLRIRASLKVKRVNKRLTLWSFIRNWKCQILSFSISFSIVETTCTGDGYIWIDHKAPTRIVLSLIQIAYTILGKMIFLNGKSCCLDSKCGLKR